MRWMRIVVVAALSVLSVGVPYLAVGPAEPAAAACAGGNRTISGTVRGEDGRFVSAQVSFVLFDSAGRTVGLDGCVRGSGYAATRLVNPVPGANPCCFVLPGTGSTSPTTTYHGQTVTLGDTWSLSGIPSNVTQVWIETYTKRSGGQPNTSTERYGHSMRRVVLGSSGTSGVQLRQPLRCGLSGGGINGSTGALTGRVFLDGRQVTADAVSVFSTSPDDGNGGSILSFNTAGAGSHPAGKYYVDAITPGTYALFITAGGVSRRVDGLRVTACGTTTVDVAVRGAVPAPPPPPPVGPVIAITGDWNGDGPDGIGLFDVGSRRWYLRETASAGAVQRWFSFGAVGDIPVVGDWNGDGVDGIGVYRPSTRQWFLRETASGGPAQRSIAYGAVGDRPVVGDWNGDGVDGIGVYRPSTRHWYVRETPTGGAANRTFAYGAVGDQPVAGDWNGDGRDGVAVYRPSDRHWYVRETPTGGAANRTFAYGAVGDQPVAGDWDGNRADGIGVFRPSTGAWMLRQGSTAGAPNLQFTYRGT